MRIVVTGGGTAGHVKPILAVTSEIKRLSPDSEVTFIRQIGDQGTYDLLASDEASSIDKINAIPAGKFRRYYGVPWQKQAIDIPMQLKNIRDGIFFLMGLVASFFLLLFNRPDAVFVKGGYVGLPVGLAAKLLKIPLVIHESDSHMGLTNRTLSKYAAAVGVGMPEQYYSLGNVETSFVGVPVGSEYHKVSAEEQAKYKKEIGLEPEDLLIMITGGSHGAERINQIAVGVCRTLISKAYVVHQAGRETYNETKKDLETNLPDNESNRYIIEPFIDDMYKYLGAADVVVSRVGMTSMAELAILAKPVVLIPNPKLVYGHQLKNAEVYKNSKAAIVVDEEEATETPSVLADQVRALLDSADERQELSNNLHQLAKPEAAKDIAKLIISKA